MKKNNHALYAVLAIIAALLVLSGLGLFYVAYRGIQALKAGAAHAAAVALSDATVLVGKSEYVGTWEGGGMRMTIDASAHVDYAKKVPGESEELHGSLSFDGADLVIDVIVFQKHVRIDKAPHLDGARWLMTLDGVELERR